MSKESSLSIAVDMTHKPSPEKPGNQIKGDVHEIRAETISRFVAIENRISTLDFSQIPFNGYHKFSGSSFRYSKEHVTTPEVLYLLGGEPEVLNRSLVVGFCGTETPTVRGFQLTELLAQCVSTLGVVVSGGVHGIDMAAHLGALDGGGPTIAVVANTTMSGIHPYVPRRAFIEQGILSSGGGILSEYSHDVEDRRERLLERDRIISGICDLLVVVEASEKSASVDTAMRAYLQGKTVLAIDWTQFSLFDGSQPKMSGISELCRLGIAEKFPLQPVTDLSDTDLTNSFKAILYQHSTLTRIPTGS